MVNTLFSTYKTGENRVTGSTLAVFERVGLELVAELLAATSGSGLELTPVLYQNQVDVGDSIPDACIRARFSWWFETKTQRGAYAAESHGRRQLRMHAAQLESDPTALLFVLTPDLSPPTWLDPGAGLDGVAESVRARVIWLGFRALADAMSTVVADPARLLGEQTRLLLGELSALYEAEGLTTADDVVVLAARAAWPEYQNRAAYVCQADRSFKADLTHMAFYAERCVQPLVPRIQGHHAAVTFTRDEALARRTAGQKRVADLIDALILDGTRDDGAAYDVWLLSGPDAEDTVHLAGPIPNDITTESGRPWAYTLGQRYARLDRLQTAATTSAI